MEALRYETNYRHDEGLRRSFCQLANETFGLDFEHWYQKGFWGENYIPYSFIDGERVVANVSVNKVNLIMKGKRHRALQIGTVMTHPDYRNRGLSGKLMENVLETFDGQVDLMYLFANEQVMEFYPKFGFKKVKEVEFILPYKWNGRKKPLLQKMNMGKKEDIAFVSERVSQRVPVSQKFCAAGTQGITMYHCLNVFSEAIFYSEKLDAIIIYTEEGSEMDLIDMIGSKPLALEEVVQEIAGESIQLIRLHFTPNEPVLQQESRRQGALFVRANGVVDYPESLKHPLTSEA